MDLVVKVTASDEASAKVGKISSKVKSGLAGAAKAGAAAMAAGTAAAAAGVAALTKSALDGYAQYEQLAGGVEKLFGDSAEAVKRFADEAYKTAGMSANRYMETVTGFSATLVAGLGGDTAKAAEYADIAIRDMSDNANVFGTDMQSIQDAYQGFARDNFELLDNLKLGYSGTAAEMARLINDSGVLGDAMEVTAETVNQVSFDQMVEAIHVVQQNMGIAGTTAREASQTIEGSVASMRAAWENWSVALGDQNADIMGKTDQLVESFVTAASNVVPRVGQILSTLSTVIVEKGPEIAAMLQENLPSFIESVVQMVLSVVQAIITALPSVIEALIAALPGIIDAIVDFLIVSLPLLIEAGLQLFLGILEALGLFIERLVPEIPRIVQTVVETLMEHLDDIIDGALQLFMAILDALPVFLEELTTRLPEIISTITTTLIQNLPAIIECAFQVFMGIVQAIPMIISELWGMLPEIGSTIIESLSQVDLGQVGRDIMDSLWSGLQSIWNDISGWFRDITSWIPDLKGPEEVDKKLLLKNGSLIMGGLLGGLEEGWGDVEDFLADKTADIGGTFDVSGRIGSAPVKQASGGGGVSIVIESFTHSGSEADDEALLERIGRKVNMRMRGVGLA